jgi:hypothetical protein
LRGLFIVAVKTGRAKKPPPNVNRSNTSVEEWRRSCNPRPVGPKETSTSEKIAQGIDITAFA